jgi:Fe-S-cluster containining protein
MDIHFGCTVCGKCCRDLRLPLTVAEAAAWLADGNPVQLICEARPWPAEIAPDDPRAAHQRRRSFAAMSGIVPVRVVVILAANLEGACPNLQADLRCGIYARRPLVCRIYPAEINPFVELRPSNKGCPAEAWSADRPLFQRDGVVADAELAGQIRRSRDTDAQDVAVKQRLCGALNLHCTALMSEGFVVHSPERSTLSAAIALATGPGADAADAASAPGNDWCFLSNRRGTVQAMRGAGARCELAGAAGSSFEYLGFQPASA